MKINSALITRTLARAGLALKQRLPQILLGSSVVCIVGGTVYACKKTLQLNDILEPTKKRIEELHKEKETIETASEDKEYQKEITKVYVKAGLDVAKLYFAPASMIIAGIGMAGMSHHIMVKQNASLAAGFASASTALEAYRRRVKEELGEEVDRHFLTGSTKKEIEVVSKDENGNDISKTETVEVPEDYDLQRISLYSFFFDPSSREWVKDAYSNRSFLLRVQRTYNEILQSRGYVFLNEILHELDIPVIAEGQRVGWWYDPENPSGDNCIDFGLGDGHSPSARDFINGYEPVVLLDFNCDGDILHHMKSGFQRDNKRK